MCDTCPAHIPGPGEVAGGLLGLAVGAALTKPGRKVIVGFCYLVFPFAVWGEFHWWTLVLVALAATVAVGTRQVLRILHRAVVMPPPTPAQRVAELERRRRNAIPVPQPRQARPALPRNLSITRRRRALPAPAKALPAAAKALPAAVVTGKVVPAERAVR